MKSKILLIIVVILSIFASCTTYLAINAYNSYKSNNQKKLTEELEQNNVNIIDIQQITQEEQEKNDRIGKEESQIQTEKANFEISSIDKQEVYDFAEAEFFRITNYGDTYIPEIHDPIVAELTAKKFGITPEEVMEIQLEISMNMYK